MVGPIAPIGRSVSYGDYDRENALDWPVASVQRRARRTRQLEWRAAAGVRASDADPELQCAESVRYAGLLGAAAVAKDAAGEDDELLVPGMELNVPTAVLERIGESPRQRWRVVIVDLELDQRPARRHPGGLPAGARAAPGRHV
jgi:hypothetical protein